jgi:hypothetical protein
MAGADHYRGVARRPRVQIGVGCRLTWSRQVPRRSSCVRLEVASQCTSGCFCEEIVIARDDVAQAAWIHTLDMKVLSETLAASTGTACVPLAHLPSK